MSTFGERAKDAQAQSVFVAAENPRFDDQPVEGYDTILCMPLPGSRRRLSTGQSRGSPTTNIPSRLRPSMARRLCDAIARAGTQPRTGYPASASLLRLRSSGSCERRALSANHSALTPGGLCMPVLSYRAHRRCRGGRGPRHTSIQTRNGRLKTVEAKTGHGSPSAASQIVGDGPSSRASASAPARIPAGNQDCGERGGQVTMLELATVRQMI